MPNVNQYLSSIRVLRKEIDKKIERYHEKMMSADGLGAVRYDKDPVQTSVTDSMIENTVIDYVELEEEIKSLQKELCQRIDEVSERIARMESLTYKCVLMWLYVDMLSCEEVAKELGCSRWTVYRIRKLAIREFQDTNKDLVS